MRLDRRALPDRLPRFVDLEARLFEMLDDTPRSLVPCIVAFRRKAQPILRRSLPVCLWPRSQ
jgi:hypothetical protein